MLYGTLPFKGLTAREVKDRVVKGRYICRRTTAGRRPISDAAISLV